MTEQPGSIGSTFPAEQLKTTGGEVLDLTALDGPAVIYFYPLDGTSTCTLQAVEFNRLAPRFREAGVTLVGVSADDDESHRCFAHDHELAFPLVADPERKLIGELGIAKDAGDDGILSRRVTYLVDRDRTIRQVWEPKDMASHAAETLDAASHLDD